MHNHGTALLDRPEAAPYSPVTAAACDIPDVCNLRRGELAAALYASDAPLRSRRELDDLAQLRAGAAQGFTRLGEELTWWIDYRSRQIGGKASPTAAEDDEYERMWPRHARRDMANDACYRLAPLGGEWPGEQDHRYVQVDVPGMGPWTLRHWFLASDLEYAERYPRRAASDCLLSYAMHSPEWLARRAGLPRSAPASVRMS